MFFANNLCLARSNELCSISTEGQHERQIITQPGTGEVDKSERTAGRNTGSVKREEYFV